MEIIGDEILSDVEKLTSFKQDYLNLINDGEKILFLRNLLDNFSEENLDKIFYNTTSETIKIDVEFKEDAFSILRLHRGIADNFNVGDVAYHQNTNKTFTIIKHDVIDNNFLDSIIYDRDNNPYIYKECVVFNSDKYLK